MVHCTVIVLSLPAFTEIRPLLDAALRGRNVTILAYGATGSGKSHTLLGPSGATGVSGGPPKGGVIAAALEYLMRCAMGGGSAVAGGARLAVAVSVCEVYNGDVACLCSECHGGGGGGGRAPRSAGRAGAAVPGLGAGPQPLRAAGGGGTQQAQSLSGASRKPSGGPGGTSVHEIPCGSWTDGAAVVASAALRRTCAATACNEGSSRGHLVTRISLRRVTAAAQDGGAGGVLVDRPLATVTIADLAGNENVRESRVSAAELSEARHVNASLSALADGKRAKRHTRGSEWEAASSACPLCCMQSWAPSCGATLSSPSATTR